MAPVKGSFGLFERLGGPPLPHGTVEQPDIQAPHLIVRRSLLPNSLNFWASHFPGPHILTIRERMRKNFYSS